MASTSLAVMRSNGEGERYVQGTAQIALPSCSG
jgi:hypothetical protein